MITIEKILDAQKTLSGFSAGRYEIIHTQYLQAVQQLHQKIVVLDDDPTGTQTVHDVSVYTSWDEDTLLGAFEAEPAMFFVLTNSRSFSEERVRSEGRKLAENIYRASKKTGKPFLLISRSDSTLRGHFPLETEVLRQELERLQQVTYDGEILIPFFQEGGRYTLNDIHYVLQNGNLIPAAQTPYAGDQTFGYKHSNLKQWIAERTQQRVSADQVISIGLDELQAGDMEAVRGKLMAAHNFQKLIVNAVCYADLEAFTVALAQAIAAGKKFLFRTAASFPKVLGNISDRGLLQPEQLRADYTGTGGLIIVGSHVPKTTQQLEQLRQNPRVAFLEFNQHLILDQQQFLAERHRVQRELETMLREGKTVAVYTRRERLDVGTGDKEAELRLANAISDALTGFVQNLSLRPAFLIAKGGITSSDIGTRGLLVQKAKVLGQIAEGVPVWKTGAESRFPGLVYVIFPGNVGDADTLRRAVETLCKASNYDRATEECDYGSK